MRCAPGRSEAGSGAAQMCDEWAGSTHGLQVALLRADGTLAVDESKEWPPAPKPLRLLLIYAAPRSLKSVRLAYWDEELTPNSVALVGKGPALSPPTRPKKQ